MARVKAKTKSLKKVGTWDPAVSSAAAKGSRTQYAANKEYSRRPRKLEEAKAVELGTIKCPLEGCHSKFKLGNHTKISLRKHIRKNCKSPSKDDIPLDLGEYIEKYLDEHAYGYVYPRHKNPSNSQRGTEMIKCPYDGCDQMFVLSQRTMRSMRNHIKDKCKAVSPNHRRIDLDTYLGTEKAKKLKWLDSMKGKRISCPSDGCNVTFVFTAKTIKWAMESHLNNHCKKISNAIPADLDEHIGFPTWKMMKAKTVECPYDGCNSMFEATIQAKHNFQKHIQRYCKAKSKAVMLVDVDLYFNQYLAFVPRILKLSGEGIVAEIIKCPYGCDTEFSVKHDIKRQMTYHIANNCNEVSGEDATIDLHDYITTQLRNPQSDTDKQKIECPNRCHTFFIAGPAFFNNLARHFRKGKCTSAAPTSAELKNYCCPEIRPRELKAIGKASWIDYAASKVDEGKNESQGGQLRVGDADDFEWDISCQPPKPETRPECNSNPLAFKITYAQYRERYGFRPEVFDTTIKSYREKLDPDISAGSKSMESGYNDDLDFHEGDINVDDDFNESEALSILSGLRRQTKLGSYLSNDAKSSPLARKNKALMEKFDIAPLCSTKCKGTRWRHGHIPCPNSNILEPFNCKLYKSKGSGGWKWTATCIDCDKIRSKIHEWILKSRRNQFGQLLCRRCVQPRVFPGILCTEHSDKRDEHRKAFRVKRDLGLVPQLKKRSNFGPSFLVKITPTDLEAALKAQKRIWFSAEWKIVQQALQENEVNDLFFIDTEFGLGRNGAIWIFQVAVLNSQGDCILDTKIDHSCTVKDIYHHPDMVQGSIGQKHLCAMYGVRPAGSKEMATTKTYGMTPKELEYELKRLILPQSTVLQWAQEGCCDYKAVISAVSKDSVPPKKQWLPTIPAWRKILPGISLGLEYFYRALFPTCKLNVSHHEALVDTKKLYNATKVMVKFMKFADFGDLHISTRLDSNSNDKAKDEESAVDKSTKKEEEEPDMEVDSDSDGGQEREWDCHEEDSNFDIEREEEGEDSDFDTIGEDEQNFNDYADLVERQDQGREDDDGLARELHQEGEFGEDSHSYTGSEMDVDEE